MSIAVENVYKSFSSPVLENVSFSIDGGQIVTIMGKNGCGKTTLFNIVAGISKPDRGLVLINGNRPDEVFPSIVYQDYRKSLFPWWTVRQNVEFAAKCRLQSNKSGPIEPLAMIDKLGIGDFDDRYPHELSGGEAQLVAIARALTFGSEVVLFDEPSSSLGFEMEQQFHREFLAYCRERSATVFFISHDPRESVYLSDLVIVLAGGPTRVKDCMDVNLAYPRDQTTPDFNSHVAHLIKLCGEVPK